jgi:hypothetical protein
MSKGKVTTKSTWFVYASTTPSVPWEDISMDFVLGLLGLKEDVIAFLWLWIDSLK